MIFSFCVFVFSFIFFPILILFGFSFIPLDWWRRIDATHAIESFKTMLLRFKTSFITKSASPVLSATSHWATRPSECIMYDKTLKPFRYCDTIRFLISLSRMFPIVRSTTTSVLESAAMTAERSSRDAKSLLLAKAITRYLLALFPTSLGAFPLLGLQEALSHDQLLEEGVHHWRCGSDETHLQRLLHSEFLWAML